MKYFITFLLINITALSHGYVNLPRIAPIPTSRDTVKEYRTFRNTEEIKGIPIIPHTGIEVKTADGRSGYIHNLGRGTEISRPSSLDMTYGEWKRPQNFLRTDELQRIGGSGYNLLTNNCYNTRDRMINALGNKN